MFFLKFFFLAFVLQKSHCGELNVSKLRKNILEKNLHPEKLLNIFHISAFSLLFSSPQQQSAVQHIEANPDAKRLYDDLLSNYNRLIRPVVNNTETLTVYLGLKITQIIEVSLRNQVSFSMCLCLQT